MQELIKIRNEENRQAVCARDLHVFLESKKDFSNWIKHRLLKYGLVENQDYYKLTQKGEPINQQVRIDYILTIEAAKELAMVEGNKKGKEARLYFIECEKKSKTLESRLSPAEFLLHQAQMLVEHEKQLQNLDR